MSGRIFKNCKEAINEIKRDIHEMGIKVHPHSMQNKIVKDDPNYETQEVQNYSFTILDTTDKNDIVGNDLDWCKAEFKERVVYCNKFTNPGKAWLLRKSTWEPFLVDGKMDYTYNARISGEDQLELVIAELKRNPDTRQAIIQIHEPHDALFMGGTRRIPCSLCYQLMIRNGKLDIIYMMRSSDFNSHFKNDIWLADELRRYISDATHIPVGLFMMNISSLHIYRGYNNDEKVF